MRILLTGGAGYIGGHCLRALRRAGVEAFAFDDLSEGWAEAVPPGRLIRGDVRDTEAVARALRAWRIDAVMHFAALVSVPGSTRDPGAYWSVNVEGTRGVLEAMRETRVRRLVVSSTAAVYAPGDGRPLREDAALGPASPYGASKLAMEMMVRDFAAAHGIGATILRYFNAAGADDDARFGEWRREETHLIPLLLRTALGRRPAFRVFGGDWPTPDGSCVRDFVALPDLAEAHRRALQATQPGAVRTFNVGTGRGASVLEVVAAAGRVLGRPIPWTMAERRPGDAPSLVADAGALGAALDWTPRRSRIEDVLATAWAWTSAHPEGYATPRRIPA
jgi:UDP-glucose-4-epimerase GalE